MLPRVDEDEIMCRFEDRKISRRYLGSSAIYSFNQVADGMQEELRDHVTFVSEAYIKSNKH